MKSSTLGLMILIMFSQIGLAQDDFTHENTIIERDKNTGLLNDAYHIKMDNNRVLFLGHINPNPFKLNQIVGLEAIIGHQIEIGWIEFSLQETRGTFEQLSDNPLQPSSNIESEYFHPREEGEMEHIFSIGTGFTYRTDLIQSLVNTALVFDTTSVFVLYHRMNESARGLIYTGPGFKCDYAIHRRSSTLLSYGLRFSYQLASVLRDEITPAEKANERNLTLSWQTIAFEFGFYF